MSLEDGGLVVVATGEIPCEVGALAADQQLGAFIQADLDIVFDLLDLGARHLCADLRVEIERAALPDGGNP